MTKEQLKRARELNENISDIMHSIRSVLAADSITIDSLLPECSVTINLHEQDPELIAITQVFLSSFIELLKATQKENEEKFKNL